MQTAHSTPHNATHSNADPHDIARFAQLANQWWNPQGALHALHAINPLRLQWIASHTPLAGSQVLDIGCGGGILSQALAQAQAHVTGIDLAQESILVAQQHAQKQHQQHGTTPPQYLCTSAETLASTHAASFDTITCMELLEHVPDPASIVQACAQLLKPGGTVFFATIAQNAKAFIHAIIAAEYLLNLVPRGTHSYSQFIQPSTLMRHCRQASLQPFASQGLHYNPLTQRYRLGSDTSVNYMLACRKPL